MLRFNNIRHNLHEKVGIPTSWVQKTRNIVVKWTSIFCLHLQYYDYLTYSVQSKLPLTDSVVYSFYSLRRVYVSIIDIL